MTTQDHDPSAGCGELFSVCERILGWLERLAVSADRDAQDKRFLSLANAYAADAKNYRATAKPLAEALSRAKQTANESSRDALNILSDEAAERGARVMAKQWNYVWSHLTPKDKNRFIAAFKVAFAAAVGED